MAALPAPSVDRFRACAGSPSTPALRTHRWPRSAARHRRKPDLNQPLSSLVNRLVMQPHQLLSLQRDHGIGPAIAIAELNLVDTRSPVLNYRSNLTAHQSRSEERRVGKECR